MKSFPERHTAAYFYEILREPLLSVNFFRIKESLIAIVLIPRNSDSIL